MNLNAPIRYFGGKGSMYNEILKHFPLHSDYDTYIEPFAGSFCVGLKKERSKIEIFNDLDKNVYSLYKVLSNNELFKSFKQRCDLTIYSEDIRYEYKMLLKSNFISIEDRAFYFFYVNRTSHNGIGGISINTIIRRNMSKSISDMLSTVDGLSNIHERLSTVFILNRDGIKLIDKFNTMKNVFVYADPPYHHDTRGLTRYSTDMDNESQKKFINSVIKSKSKILISGYDCELYSQLEINGFTKTMFNVNTTTGTHKPKTKTEFLWKNY